MDRALTISFFPPKEIEDFARTLCHDSNRIHSINQGERQIVPGDYLSSFYLANCNGNLFGKHSFNFLKPVFSKKEPISFHNGKIQGLSSGIEYGRVISENSSDSQLKINDQGERLSFNEENLYNLIATYFPSFNTCENYHPIASSVLATRMLSCKYEEELLKHGYSYDEESSLAKYTNFSFIVDKKLSDTKKEDLELMLNLSSKCLRRQGIVKQKVVGTLIDRNNNPVLSLEKEVAFMRLIPVRPNGRTLQ